MIYADSSAILKLILPEAESSSMRKYVGSPSALYTSVVGGTEVRRAVRRHAPERLAAAEELLAQMSLIGTSKEVLRIASLLEPVAMRTLDAIHLASALSVREQLDAFVAYDNRLIEAARVAGVPVVSPQ